MYAHFLGLKHEPFSIAPDPRYLFMSERHREALAHLLYGVGGGGGFVLLTGEIGAGKTTVCRCFLEQIPRRCNVAYIFNPKLTVTELLKSVCDEFRIPCAPPPSGQATVKDYLDPLNEFLLKTHAVGQNNVLIIDEAQNLSADVLEQLRLLTNLETSERKLLQIILIGQPELRTMLARPELEQLAQRVIARFHLDALSEAETASYVAHRLQIAGWRRGRLFSDPALKRVHELARGVPRRINLLCDRALLGAYAQGKSKIDRRTVEQAAREVFDAAVALPATPRGRFSVRPLTAWLQQPGVRWGAAIVAGAALSAALGWTLLSAQQRRALEPMPHAASSSTGAAAAVMSSDLSTLPRPPARSATVAAPASTPASPPPAALAPATALQAWLVQQPQTADHADAAWRELAALWGVATSEGDPCITLQAQQLRCFKGRLTLATLRELDRPGLLLLQTPALARPVPVLITALDGERATLRRAGQTQTVSVATLSQWWRGDYATFWRAPAGFQGKLAEGHAGPLVDELSTQLARWLGTPAPVGRYIFDAPLREQVRAFQLAHGLQPDGQAGPTTFMQLNRVLGVDEPRLRAAPTGASPGAPAPARANH